MESLTSERGSLSLASLGVTIILTALALGGVMVGQIAWARVSAASTADLAALAAVVHGCDGGADIAERNQARVISCDWENNAVTVEVERDMHGLSLPFFDAPKVVVATATATLTP